MATAGHGGGAAARGQGHGGQPQGRGEGGEEPPPVRGQNGPGHAGVAEVLDAGGHHGAPLRVEMVAPGRQDREVPGKQEDGEADQKRRDSEKVPASCLSDPSEIGRYPMSTW